MLNQINDDDLATYMLDHGVNTGMNAMVVVVQAAVNTVADGQIGPHTIAAINSTYQPSMLPTIMNGLWAHYQKILVAHPEDEKFRNGWHNRCFSL
jgi:lysozyme family protein